MAKWQCTSCGLIENNALVCPKCGQKYVTIHNRCVNCSTNLSSTPPCHKCGGKMGSGAGSSGGGCYVATCIYGSYDCPEVWTLRRFRDKTLSQSFWGKLFIRAYYAVSPHIVKISGNQKWFHSLWKPLLNKVVHGLYKRGVSGEPYQDECGSRNDK